MIIGTCYAFLNITGESSHHGTWFQGKKVWDEVNRAKCTTAANVLIKLCKSKNFKTKDDFLNKYLEANCLYGRAKVETLRIMVLY